MPAFGLTSGYKEVVLAPSAARTATGQTATLAGYGGSSTLRAQLDVTAVSGTSPTLNVLVEDTLDGSTWNTIGTFAQRTATGREVINVTAPFAERVRVSWTVGGTAPSFTFEVRTAAQSPMS